MKGIAGGIAGVCGGLLAAAFTFADLDQSLVPAAQQTWSPAELSQMVVGLVTAIVGWIIASRRPGNPIGWLALAAGALLDVSIFCNSYALRALVAAPGSLPAGHLAMWVHWWAGQLPVPCLGFVLLLFPDGELPGPRWRPVAWFAAAIFAWVSVTAVVGATLVWSHPFVSFYQVYTPGPFASLWFRFPLPIALAVCVAAVVARFIRSSGVERCQLTLFAVAAAILVVAFVPRIAAESAASTIAVDVAVISLEATLALAVLKYRLYDIDIVISRTVQYGALAAFIAAVYSGLVIGVGALWRAGLARMRRVLRSSRAGRGPDSPG